MSYLGRENSFLGYAYSHVPATFLTHDSTLPHSTCVRIISDLEHLSFSLVALFFLALLAKSSLFSLFCEPPPR